MKRTHFSLRILSFLFACILAMGLMTFPASAEASVTDQVKQLIVYYKEYQENAETDIMRVLDEMRAINSGKAKVWEEIMDYWHYVNTDMTVNVGTIPENLPTDNSLAIVILGYALNADGSMKPELIGRLQTGLSLANAYPNSYVVVTGGGTASNAPTVTEGGAMGAWLVENGLSADRLIIEDKAPDTVGNAKNTYQILSTQYPQVTSYVMVTSDYHVPRGSILFQSKNLLEAYEAMTSPLDLVSNAGYYTGTNGYESVALQASGVASVAGVSISGVTVTLSQLTQLNITVNDDLSLEAIATYHNGYSRDISEKLTVTGLDASLGKDQTVAVSYTENGITVSGDVKLSDKESVLFSAAYLENLVAEAELLVASKYTATSFAVLTEKLTAAKAVLAKAEPTLQEVGNAYTELKKAIGDLVLLPNVALGKPATTNSVGSYPASKINDGTVTTSSFWASMTASGNMPAKDAWVIIDLDGTYNVEAITVYPYWAGNRVYKYELYGTTDGEEWFKLAEMTDDTAATTAGFTHAIDATVTKVKLQGISTYVPGRGDINNMHIIEMEVYGAEVGNLCLNKVVSSSGSDQSAASSASATSDKINDGDPATYWDGGKYADEPFVTVDLEGLYLLDEINVTCYWKSTRYYQYEVYTSLDGIEFTKIGAKTDTANETILGTDFDLNGKQVYARYIKIVGTYNSANVAFHINELRAYGTKVAEDLSYVGLQLGQNAVRFVGTVTEEAAKNYDKVDLAVSFVAENGEVRNFTAPTSKVYRALNSKNGVAVAVKKSPLSAGLDESCVFDAAALFAYAVTDIPAGTYTVTVTPVGYVGETAVSGMAITYNSISVAENGTVSVTK